MGLLKEAGAEVYLTRSAERDFIGADSVLAADLRVRVEMVDSLRPDIFVSVHHNAQPQRDPDKNAVETYYRFGDPASRDLAFAVHRHLMRNLGIREGEVRPGNYFVLRNLDIPAILGESAYLTHPEAEEKLRLSDTQRLEAEAYFLGILEYFSRGTPRMQRQSPLDSILTEVPSIAFGLEDIGGLGIDPAAVSLTVNDVAVTATLDAAGSTASYQLPWDAPNGPYAISLGVRNVLGNASRIERFRFELNYPAVDAHFNVSPRTPPAGRGSARVRARLVDERGLAIADGSRVAVDVRGGSAPDTAVVDQGVVEFPVRLDDGGGKIEVTLTSGDKTFAKDIARAPDGAAPYRQVAFAGTTAAIGNASLAVGDSIIATGSNSGTYFVPLGLEDNRTIRVQAPGYRPLEATVADFKALETDTMVMAPWYGGTLLGAALRDRSRGRLRPATGYRRTRLVGRLCKLAGRALLVGVPSRSGRSRIADSRDRRDAVAARRRIGHQWLRCAPIPGNSPPGRSRR